MASFRFSSISVALGPLLCLLGAPTSAAAQVDLTVTALAGPAVAGSGGQAGRVKENVAPRSGLFSAQIRPPCASTMERLIGNPIPIPVGFVV